MKEFETTISNGRKLSKRVENTVGKGVIDRYEQFLLFPQCFQKACFPGASKGVIVWEWVNCYATTIRMLWGYTRISQCVHMFVCPVYKILVILCCEVLLKFRLICTDTLLVHWLYIEVLQDAILKCQFPWFWKLPVSFEGQAGL